MKRLILALVLLVPSCSGDTSYPPVDWTTTQPPPSRSNPIPPPAPQANTLVDKLFALHNDERTKKGRAKLSLDPYLNDYAQKYAEDMARRNRLNHSDISRLMGKYNFAGENIAWNQQNEQQVVHDWMNSSGHRANILNRNFTKVGFGMARNSQGEPYWCTVFGG